MEEIVNKFNTYLDEEIKLCIERLVELEEIKIPLVIPVVDYWDNRLHSHISDLRNYWRNRLDEAYRLTEG